MAMADQKPLSIVASIKPVHALATLAADAQSVALDDSAGLVLFDFDDDEHDDHDGHGEQGINPHIWLDPFNAQIMLRVIADHLGKADPANAKTFQANADVMRQNLVQLEIVIARQLALFAESEFLVLHDAHIYFKRRFGMRAHGAITIEPEVIPTAAKIKKLRHDLESHPMECIFSEPLLGQKAVGSINEGTDIPIGHLDPLGSQLPAEASLYADPLKSFAVAFKACLAP